MIFMTLLAIDMEINCQTMNMMKKTKNGEREQMLCVYAY